MSFIGFENYRIPCIIGLEAHERSRKQDIFIDLKVEIDCSKLVLSDDIKDTIDYTSLADLCLRTANEGKYYLLEKYASDVIALIFKQFDANSVWIRVKKTAGLAEATCTFAEIYQKNLKITL